MTYTAFVTLVTALGDAGRSSVPLKTSIVVAITAHQTVGNRLGVAREIANEGNSLAANTPTRYWCYSLVEMQRIAGNVQYWTAIYPRLADHSCET